MATKTVTAEVTMPKAQPLRDAVHIISQKKGGVGKSAIAQILAEYLFDKYKRVRCFDTDPSQPTFARVEGLKVERVHILKGDDIDPMLIEPVLEGIIADNGPFVLDTGSSSYHSLWSYIAGAQLFEVLGVNERPVIVHVPIAARPDFDDTLAGFEEIAERSPDNSVVIWLNERDQPIGLNGEEVTALETVQRQASKVRAVVIGTLQRRRWNRDAIGDMLSNHLTFRQAIEGHAVFKRSYLHNVRAELFKQLEEAEL